MDIEEAASVVGVGGVDELLMNLGPTFTNSRNGDISSGGMKMRPPNDRYR